MLRGQADLRNLSVLSGQGDETGIFEEEEVAAKHIGRATRSLLQEVPEEPQGLVDAHGAAKALKQTPMRRSGKSANKTDSRRDTPVKWRQKDDISPSEDRGEISVSNRTGDDALRLDLRGGSGANPAAAIPSGTAPPPPPPPPPEATTTTTTAPPQTIAGTGSMSRPLPTGPPPLEDFFNWIFYYYFEWIHSKFVAFFTWLTYFMLVTSIIAGGWVIAQRLLSGFELSSGQVFQPPDWTPTTSEELYNRVRQLEIFLQQTSQNTLKNSKETGQELTSLRETLEGVKSREGLDKTKLESLTSDLNAIRTASDRLKKELDLQRRSGNRAPVSTEEWRTKIDDYLAKYLPEQISVKSRADGSIGINKELRKLVEDIVQKTVEKTYRGGRPELSKEELIKLPSWTAFMKKNERELRTTINESVETKIWDVKDEILRDINREMRDVILGVVKEMPKPLRNAIIEEVDTSIRRQNIGPKDLDWTAIRQLISDGIEKNNQRLPTSMSKAEIRDLIEAEIRAVGPIKGGQGVVLNKSQARNEIRSVLKDELERSEMLKEMLKDIETRLKEETIIPHMEKRFDDIKQDLDQQYSIISSSLASMRRNLPTGVPVNSGTVVPSPYAFDIVGLPDYANAASGGRIWPHITSTTYDALAGRRSTGRWALSFISNVQELNPPLPINAIQGFIDHGHCWPFPGSHGYLAIRLSDHIHVSHLTIEHWPKATAKDISTAPRQFRLWAHVANETLRESIANNQVLNPSEIRDRARAEEFAPILDGEFSQLDEGRQSWEVNVDLAQLGIATKFVVLEVLNNHGSKVKTELYRVKVHGLSPEKAHAFKAGEAKMTAKARVTEAPRVKGLW